MILQSTNDLKSGPITDVGESRIVVPTKIPLTDESIRRSIENRAPSLPAHALDRVRSSVQLCHPPIVKEFATTHRIAEMNLPNYLASHPSP